LIIQVRTSKFTAYTNKTLSYRRELAAGCVIVFAKIEDWNWETVFYKHYIQAD